MNFKCAAVMVLVSGTLAWGCSIPTYYHSYKTKYNADGKIIGYEEVEGITQPSPTSSPMKVLITRPDKIER